MKCQAGTQTRWPEPAAGPSWALAPCCYARWERRRPRQEACHSRNVAAVGGLASPQRQRPAVTMGLHSWSQSQASPARDHQDPRTLRHQDPRTLRHQGWARWGCRQWEATHRPGADPGLRGGRLPTPDWLAGGGQCGPKASKPHRGERWPLALEWRPGHHPQGAGSPRLTPGEGGPVAAGPTLRAGGEARPARWRDAREWTGSQQGPPSGLLSTHNMDLGALDRWCPKHCWTHPLQRKRLPLETETLL